MIFEFIIVYQPQENEPVLSLLQEKLEEVFSNEYNQETGDLPNIKINFERQQSVDTDEGKFIVLGFSLELSDNISSLREVVDEFTKSLVSDNIEHVIKCEDHLLYNELRDYAKNIFFIEMKLRRVLSVIYLHAYPKADPYNLLFKDSVQVAEKEKPTEEQMKELAENQFFHLTFSQYIHLNQRKNIKNIAEFIESIRDKDTFEIFREQEISGSPSGLPV
ncbi:MAG: hypothetical protein LBU11_08080 [Zoogloeaceae bacterium]|nr:hypothetical protein [Zoogloeaceae bacterium]